MPMSNAAVKVPVTNSSGEPVSCHNDELCKLLRENATNDLDARHIAAERIEHLWNSIEFIAGANKDLADEIDEWRVKTAVLEVEVKRLSKPQWWNNAGDPEMGYSDPEELRSRDFDEEGVVCLTANRTVRKEFYVLTDDEDNGCTELNGPYDTREEADAIYKEHNGESGE